MKTRLFARKKRRPTYLSYLKSRQPKILLLAHSSLVILLLLLVVAGSHFLITTGALRSLINAQQSLSIATQILVAISLPLAALLYIYIDYQEHRKSLLAVGKGKGIRGYTLSHHLLLVNVPLIRFRLRDTAVTMAVALIYLCGFSGFFAYTIHRSSTAAPGILTVTLNQKTGLADPNPSYTSVFTATFSEAIDRSTFTAADITLGGTAPGQTVQSITEAGSFDGTTFEIRIAAAAAGTIQPSIAAEAVSAVNGSSGTNQESTATDNEVTYDGSWAQDKFVFKVKTDEAGSSASDSFRVSTSVGYTYNFHVDCNNDGTPEYTNQASSVLCTYESPGEYIISVNGQYPRLWFGGDNDKLLDIVQWGNNEWLGMSMGLGGAANASISAIDAPDMSSVTSIQSLFNGATSFNSNINHWDVSNVTDMQWAFSDTPAFNQPLNNWDVSNVTNMGSMFGCCGSGGATSFNQPLNNWDVSNVTNMASMFNQATSFNQPLNNWDVSKVTNMSYMFASATNFNQPLNSWNTTSVTNMAYMFYRATSFDEPIGNWVTGSVTNMEGMFYDATSFNQPLNSWNTISVTTMESMFRNAISFNQPLNNWSTNEVTHLTFMFAGARDFNQSLAGWNVEKVLFINGMFGNAGGLSPYSSGLSSPNYDSTLDAWSQQNLKWGLNFDAGTSTYCNAADSRMAIGLTYGWSINDSGLSCPPVEQRPFIMKVKTDNPGITSGNEFAIPLYQGLGAPVYNFDVDCDNDGTPEYTDHTGSEFVVCEYPSPGEYEVAISGDFPRINFNNQGDKNKLIDIMQWGDIVWHDMGSAFYGTTNMTMSATDAPNLSWGSDISLWGMFRGASSFNSDISHWDVSNVGVMANMFMDATSFNQPLNNWDMSNVTSTSGMFNGATSFNQPLDAWNVGNVTDMAVMFQNTSSFDQNINVWDVSSVNSMSGMFASTSVYNQPLNNWDVSSVTDMSSMFSGALLFDQALNSWDVSSVVNMANLFNGAAAFNQNIGNWNVSNVTNMEALFANTTSFNQPLSSWDVSSVINMKNMFTSAFMFNQPLNAWGTKTSNVENMMAMFAQAISFNQDISSWDVGSVTTMMSMFAATPFNYPLNTWDVGNVTDFGTMFGLAESFNQPLNNWNTSNATNMLGMFAAATSFDQSLAAWDVSSASNMMFMFGDASFAGAESDPSGLSTANYDSTLIGWSGQVLQSSVTFDAGSSTYCTAAAQRQSIIDTFAWTINDSGEDCPPEPTQRPFIMKVKTDNPGQSEDNEFTINGHGSYYDVDCDNDGTPEHTNQSSTVTCVYPEPGEYNIAISGNLLRLNNGSVYPSPGVDIEKIVDVVQWGDIEWDSVGAMFSGAINLQISATDAPDLSNVADMGSMFANATSFDSNINHWDVSNVTDMSGIFRGATSFNQPLNNWDVSNVTHMGWMFKDAASFDQNISSWDVSNVTITAGMFAGATSFNQPLNDWDVSSVTHVYVDEVPGMFAGATSFNQPLNDWDVSSVNNMAMMFADATSFNQDISSWDVSSVTVMAYMFVGATSFNQPLNSWDVSNVSNMAMMFAGAPAFNQPLDSWNTDSVTNMMAVFAGASSFDQSLATWNVSNVTDMQFMFIKDIEAPGWNTLNNSGLSTANYDATLIGWSAQSLQTSVTFDAGTSTYCEAEAERQSILFNFVWVINDSGEDCPTVEDPSLFIMRIKTDNPGNSANNSFIIPTNTDDYTYNYNVDCDNDGIIEHTNQTGDVTCVYDSPGEYELAISGTFPHMMHGAGNDPQKIINIVQWGDIEWQDMQYMFTGAANLQISASDAPDLSNVTDMSYMFWRATSFNSNINHWDVSNVTDMRSMFNEATAFNQPLSNWNVGNVTTTSYMFVNATSFNMNINTWDISNVTNMGYMFAGASNFNQPLDSWDTSNVLNIGVMFGCSIVLNVFQTQCADNFNQPLDSWDTSSVVGMLGTFMGAASFNQPLDSWDTSNVTNMYMMFTGASSFNQPLNNWDVSNVTNMQMMFAAIDLRFGDSGFIPTASSFNQPLNNWDTSSVTDSSMMFMLATQFNQPLNNWNTSNIQSMVAMFMAASSFDQSLAAWDVSSVVNGPGQPNTPAPGGMQYMFGSFDDLIDQAMNGTPIENWPEEYTEIYGQTDSGLSTANYDATLIAWSGQSLQTGITFDAGSSTYCTAEAQRQSIITNFSWTINDQGKDCSSPTTDFGLTISLATVGQIKVGDPVTYRLRVTNHGVVAIPFAGYLYNVLPSEFSFISNTNTSNIVCQDMGEPNDPYFKQTFPSLHLLVCTPAPNITFQPGDYIEFDIQGTATANYTHNTTASRAVYWDDVYEPDFFEELTNAMNSSQDFSELNANNVGRAVYSYVTTTNPPPGPPEGPPRVPPIDRPRQPDSTVAPTDPPAIPGLEKIFPPATTLEQPEPLTPTSTTNTNVPFYFISLLLLVALFYLYLAYKDYRRSRNAAVLVERYQKNQHNIRSFLDISTHYLGTPLAVLKGAVELMTSKQALAASTIKQLEGHLKNLDQIVDQATSTSNNALEGAVVSANMDSGDKITPAELLKDKRVWLPLTIGAGLIIIVDVSLMAFGGYELKHIRFANQVAFFGLSALGVMLAAMLMLRQRQLAKERAAVIQTEQQLANQQRLLLDQTATQIHTVYDKLRASSQEFSGIKGTETYFNGLAMLGNLAEALTRTSRFATDTGNAPLQSLQDTVTGAITNLEQQYHAKNLNITVSIPAELSLQAQQEEADFLVSTLIKNAVEFSPENGAVNIQAINKGSSFVLTVTDQGPGIPPETLQQLFKPFSRGTDTQTFNHEGLGLSLYSSKLLVEKLGGTISVANRPENQSGVIATIKLPRHAANATGLAGNMITPQQSL